MVRVFCFDVCWVSISYCFYNTFSISNFKVLSLIQAFRIMFSVLMLTTNRSDFRPGVAGYLPRNALALEPNGLRPHCWDSALPLTQHRFSYKSAMHVIGVQHGWWVILMRDIVILETRCFWYSGTDNVESRSGVFVFFVFSISRVEASLGINVADAIYQIAACKAHCFPRGENCLYTGRLSPLIPCTIPSFTSSPLDAPRQVGWCYVRKWLSSCLGGYEFVQSYVAVISPRSVSRLHRLSGFSRVGSSDRNRQA